MNSTTRKFLLISLDALSNTDWQKVSTLPHFQKIIQHGAYSTAMRSVYPSLTFPCHASIATGCTPENHGITNNYLFDPFSPIHLWNFDAAGIKRKALWDYAAENKHSVLSLSWPVSSGAPIRYSLPEMTPAVPKEWNIRNFFRQIIELMKYGTPRLVWDSLLFDPAFSKAWFFGHQPRLDEKMIALVEKAIHKYPFDIAMAHVYGLDAAKHDYGIDSEQAQSYLPLYDGFIGRLIDYCDQAASRGEDITLMVFGDHGQRAVHSAVYGNHILERMGLCQWEAGRLQSWQAIMDSGDGMAYIYFREDVSPETIQAVGRTFAENPGVSRVCSGDEHRGLGAQAGEYLVLDAAEGCGFEGGWHDGTFTDEKHAIAPNPCLGLHGYCPELPMYHPLFFCYGKSVIPQEIEKMSIMDICPTVAQHMGYEAGPMDGKALRGLFREE